jgi:hypothetical protein
VTDADLAVGDPCPPANPAVPFSGDADFFYTQYTINF